MDKPLGSLHFVLLALFPLLSSGFVAYLHFNLTSLFLTSLLCNLWLLMSKRP